ncbi:zona pellucida sperm-binding protein 3-like [Pseudophryne corroboree]|uniref:zona pellucida sperm-binding protein 3-like n=1 Tax=Pseudophryne corroboree TaxID=495146 RepID=UPI003081B85B
MRMCVRWRWLLLVALVYSSGFAGAGEHVLVRRQSESWWSHYQSSVLGAPRRSHVGAAQPVSGLGSSRSGAQPVSGLGSPRWGAQPVSGLGSSRSGALPVSGWGSPIRFGGEPAQPRQLPPPQSSPISVQCGEDTLVVTVMRNFYGNGNLVKDAELSLGACEPGPQTTDTMVVFENAVQDCGSSLQVTPQWLIYTTSLVYSPVSSNAVIIRSNPAVVPIQCYYPRYGNVSSEAIEPTWVPFSTTVSTEERLSFSLQLMMDDWSALRPSSVFELGDMFYIEASVDTQNHAPMMLFVDSCVATLSPDVQSTPNYAIIAYNGCLVDGRQEDSSSTFISPRSQLNQLQFMVDAFRFTGIDVSLIYITCYLRAVAASQTPDPLNKACSYSKASSSWSAVEGSSGICQCCNTGNCVAPAGQSRSSGSRRPRMWKREVADYPEEHGLATLGPLLVIGAESNPAPDSTLIQASRMTAESKPLELWVLVAIVSVSLAAVIIGLVMVGHCVLRRLSRQEAVSK